MDVRERARGAILGALVADAAAMGLHWIYDVDRVRDLGGAEPEFHDPVDYHQGRAAGAQTHYGDHLLVTLESLVESDGLDAADYSRRYRERFGEGYDGYVDHASKGLLASGEGADDDQAGCFAKLPPLVVRYLLDPDLAERVEESVRVTHENARAVRHATAAARAIRAAVLGSSPASAVRAASAGGGTTGERVAAALDGGDDVVAFAAEHGQACTVTNALPVALHAALHGPTFEECVRGSILSGGDTAGRLLVTGAIRGATDGVPESWLARLAERERIESLTARLLDGAALP